MHIRGIRGMGIVLLIITLTAAAGCSAAAVSEDGWYGAYYALPDEHGWRESVWIQVDEGISADPVYQRTSAFGEYAVEAAAAMPTELHERAEQAVEAGAPAAYPVDRSSVFSAESFVPDSDGVRHRFQISAAAEDGQIRWHSPQVTRLTETQEETVDLTAEFNTTAEALRESLSGVLPISHPSEVYPALQKLEKSPRHEQLRALIVRATALSIQQDPRPPHAHQPQESVQQDTATAAAGYNQTAAVTSSHFLATEAGMEILDSGGNAADASVAVAAALSVVEPWFSSALGGGTWALYFDSASGEVSSQDGVGPTASRNTAEYYAPRASQNGLHQSIVPGAWGGWMEWLQEHGSLPLDEVLAPAIRLAEDGFPASEELVTWLERGLDEVRSRPDTAAIYLTDGSPPSAGDTLRMPNLAASFRELSDTYTRFAADRGHRGGLAAAADYYYRGPLAERIADFSADNEGPFALSDFTSFYGRIVDPISIDYKGLRVYQNPPNSQGITQLMALNILKEFDFAQFSGPNDPDSVHVITEAIKLAQIDKYYHVGDPEYTDVPTQELLGEAHATARRQAISMDSVITWPVANILPVDPAHTHTTTFQVIDADGNAASTTTSLGAQFYVIGDTGIHINNRMRMLSVSEGDPNLTVPGKKVRHTSNPYMVLQNGIPYILGGNTGVDTQPQGQTQQFINVVEYGMDPQEAVSHPRFITSAFPAAQYPWEADNDLGMEAGTPQELIDAMRNRGHRVTQSGIWGNANMILIDPDGGAVSTGADPRSGVELGMTAQEAR